MEYSSLNVTLDVTQEKKKGNSVTFLLPQAFG
jgi:hypothetical protein